MCTSRSLTLRHPKTNSPGLPFFAVCVALFLAPPLCAQVQDESQAPARAYDILPENDDWTFLANPSLRSDLWDPIKYIPLSCEACYVSLGGEIREDFEHVGNDNWGAQPYMNSFLLQRYMVQSDWHLGENLRAFVEFKSGLEDLRGGGPRPIEEKRLDFEAAFLEVGNTHRKNWAILRVGRAELNYGSGRLVAVREGPNVRQSFDGAKIRSKAGSWYMDAWAVRPDLDRFGFFDNAPDHTTAFWGVYASRPLLRGIGCDLYYLGLDRKNATFNRGTATELRHTIGGRLWRPIATQHPAVDFDYEGVVQFGTFGSDGLLAWTFASDTGYTLATVPLRPRFSIKADISSGDNPATHTLGTFNPLFPIGNYFGELQDTGPGPVNFFDVHPRIQAQLPHSVSISMDLLVQWRESLNDGVYAVPGNLLVPADGSRARFVGYQPGTEVRWQIDRHAYLQGDYGIYYAGAFLKQASPGRNLNYLALWAGYNF